MIPYTVTVPGNPGAARLNGRSTPIRRGGGTTVILSANYKAWRALAVPLMRAVMRGRRPFHGAVTVEIATWWPRVHRVGPCVGLPLGDVDACCKAVLDALKHAGVYGDDGQTMAMPVSKGHDREFPRVVVTVEEYQA